MSDDAPPPFTPEQEDRIRLIVREEIEADRAAKREAAAERSRQDWLQRDPSYFQPMPELSAVEWIHRYFGGEARRAYSEHINRQFLERRAAVKLGLES